MSPSDVHANRPTITLHMVSSLDGFIDRKDNSVAWLDGYEDVYERGVSEGSAAESETVESIDCYVLGSRTYEHALELGWPYGDTPTVVLTNRKLSSPKKSVEFYSGDLHKLVDEVLAPRYKNVWLVGGANVGDKFLLLDLVDEIRITIAPILLGDGLRFFGNSAIERRWQLKDSVAYKNGFVALRYARQPAKPKP